MNLREALIHQTPSLELQRAAASEIARQDDEIRELRRVIEEGLLARQPAEESDGVRP